jgi:hypothetical protein
MEPRERILKISASTNATCRYCATPLDALALRRGRETCGAPKCRHKLDVARTALIKTELATAAPSAARTQLQLRDVPVAVVWLRHCEPEMVAVTAEDRASHKSYLESVVSETMVIDRSRLAEPTADDSHPQGARLCGQCRGRCCEAGGAWRAFTDFTVLSRWQQAHPESSLADAVDAYMALLPAEHVQGACLYQSATGCVMPREQRADICNHYACDSLQRTQSAAASDPRAAVVAITFHKDQVERAAVIAPEATRAFELVAPEPAR